MSCYSVLQLILFILIILRCFQSKGFIKYFMPLIFYLRIVVYVIFLLSAAIALFVKLKYGIKGNMMLLFFYNLQAACCILTSICELWLKVLDNDSMNKVLFATSILHYSLLSLFVLFIKQPNMKTKAIKIYVAIGIVTACLLLLATNYHNPMCVFIVNNGGLFILCCIYFIRLFSSTDIVMIKSEPSFWVVAGIWICMCISLPFAVYRIFLFSKVAPNIALQQNVYYILNIGYILMHLFFIKAYSCLIAQAKK